jgi:hypothetical protein
MKPRIIDLTPAQKARLPEFVQKWTDIGLSTEPANRAEAERGVRLAYKLAGLKEPERIIWCGSPLSQALTRAIVFGLANGGIKVKRASVRDSVRDSVWASVWASVGASVYGQHDANWLGFYDYFAEVCGLGEETQKLMGLWLIAKNAGWFLPHAKTCWISERHCLLKRDDGGRLHCKDGPALAYPDGFSIYAWHGLRVPPDLIEHRDKITVQDIEAEFNAELRRVKIELYGPARYLQDSNAVEVHRDRFGTLYRKELPGDEPVVMVHLLNSTPEQDGSLDRNEAVSIFARDTLVWDNGVMRPIAEVAAELRFKDYFLRVPPDIDRARQAVAWTWDEPEASYNPCIQT